MKKRTILFLLLSALLAACTSTAPALLPTAAQPSLTGENQPQAPSPTLTPLLSPTSTQTNMPVPTAAPTPFPGNGLNLERVAQLGGSIFGITIVGDVAYVGMGPRVAAIDISQREKPQLVRQSKPLPGLVTQLLQISNGPASLLLVNAGKYLLVIDPSNPGELKPIRQLELDGAVTAMVWDAQASILYAGGSIYQNSFQYTGFISSVAISSDFSLKLMDTVTMPEQPLSLALGEGSLFAGAGGYKGGLYRSQVKPPGELSTPLQVIASTPERPLPPVRMQVIGGRLYLSYRSLQAYDITEPNQPKQIWEKNLQGGPVMKGFSLVADQFYIFGWTILSEYVRYTITAPEPIEGSPSGAAASVTAMHNGDFLVAYNDLEVYDTADPQDLRLTGSYQSPVVNAIGAAANEEAVFVVDHGIENSPSTAVLQALSLPDLKPLGQVTVEFPTSWGQVCYPWMVLDGDRLYLASANSVWVYDVSSLQPGLLGKVDIAGGRKLNAMAAFTQGEKRLLAVSQDLKYLENNLAVYDLTDVQKPARLGNPLALDKGTFFQMTLKGTALYVTMSYTPGCHCGMLYVIDIKNNTLAKRESLQLPEYIEYFAVGNDLAAMASTQGLTLVSAPEPGPLKILSSSALPAEGRGAAIIGDWALVAAGGEDAAAQLLAFDIQDPANPRQVKAVDIAASNNYIVPTLLTKSYAILANGMGGVEVFSLGAR